MNSPSLSIQSIKKNFLFVILPVVSLGVSLILLFVLIIPQVTNIRKNVDQQKSLKTKQSNLKSKRETLEKFVGQEAEMDSLLGLLTNALPLTTSVPGLMSQVENIASKSAVAVANLQFAGTSDYLSRQQEAKEVVKKDYQELILQVGVDCNLNSLQNFLENLEISSRLVSFRSFKFSPLGEGTEGGQELRAIISLVAFYKPQLKDQTIDKAINLSLDSPKFLEVVNKIKNLEQYETGEGLSF